MLIFSPRKGSSSLATISVQTVVPAPGFCGTTNVISAVALVVMPSTSARLSSNLRII